MEFKKELGGQERRCDKNRVAYGKVFGDIGQSRSDHVGKYYARDGTSDFLQGHGREDSRWSQEAGSLDSLGRDTGRKGMQCSEQQMEVQCRPGSEALPEHETKEITI